ASPAAPPAADKPRRSLIQPFRKRAATPIHNRAKKPRVAPGRCMKNRASAMATSSSPRATFSQKEDRMVEMNTGGRRLLFRSAYVPSAHQAAMAERSSFKGDIVQ